MSCATGAAPGSGNAPLSRLPSQSELLAPRAAERGAVSHPERCTCGGSLTGSTKDRPTRTPGPDARAEGSRQRRRHPPHMEDQQRTNAAKNAPRHHPRLPATGAPRLRGTKAHRRNCAHCATCTARLEAIRAGRIAGNLRRGERGRRQARPMLQVPVPAHTNTLT